MYMLLFIVACTCSDFVNPNGYGECKKQDSDFGNSVTCYVNLPSECTDLIESGTNPGKFLSAEACSVRGNMPGNIMLFIKYLYPGYFCTIQRFNY